jgi:hypothetical protein
MVFYAENLYVLIGFSMLGILFYLAVFNIKSMMMMYSWGTSHGTPKLFIH